VSNWDFGCGKRFLIIERCRVNDICTFDLCRAGAQHHFGQTIAFLGFGWCGFGVFISSVMILMVWWHARRHVARLTIIPGVVDEVIVSTHNMLGNSPHHSDAARSHYDAE
jgi:hypothetical protein